jgi:hypothetical protein
MLFLFTKYRSLTLLSFESFHIGLVREMFTPRQSTVNEVTRGIRRSIPIMLCGLLSNLLWSCTEYRGAYTKDVCKFWGGGEQFETLGFQLRVCWIFIDKYVLNNSGKDGFISFWWYTWRHLYLGATSIFKLPRKTSNWRFSDNPPTHPWKRQVWRNEYFKT